MRPNVYLLIARTWQGFRGIQIIMTKLRFVLLATTALTAMQLIASASHAQNAPLIVAQREELGPDGKPKQRPAPPAAAPGRRTVAAHASAAPGRRTVAAYTSATSGCGTPVPAYTSVGSAAACSATWYAEVIGTAERSSSCAA